MSGLRPGVRLRLKCSAFKSTKTDVGPEDLVLKVNLVGCLVYLAASVFQVVTKRRYTQHSAAVGVPLAVDPFCAAVEDLHILAKVLVSLLSLLVTFLVLLLMYKYVPHRKVAWGDVWLGALLGAMFLEGGKNLFAWYVSNFGSFNVVYGSLGALMAILVWVYISAVILLLAAHLSAVYCRVVGSEASRP